MGFEDSKKERLEHIIAAILSLSNSLKLLTQSALDFQSLGIAKKHNIEEVVDQAEDLEDVLGALIKVLKEITEDFVNTTFNKCHDSNSY